MSRTEDKFLVSENMLFWAFRYALGRRTYAVIHVADELKTHWGELNPYIKSKIKIEINTAIEQNEAGDELDIKLWKKILDL